MDPLESDEVAVANFLASQFEDGKQYRTLYVYRSAISSTLLVRSDSYRLGNLQRFGGSWPGFIMSGHRNLAIPKLGVWRPSCIT